jgi:hypothetical protein
MGTYALMLYAGMVKIATRHVKNILWASGIKKDTSEVELMAHDACTSLIERELKNPDKVVRDYDRYLKIEARHQVHGRDKKNREQTECTLYDTMQEKSENIICDSLETLRNDKQFGSILCVIYKATTAKEALSSLAIFCGREYVEHRAKEIVEVWKLTRGDKCREYRLGMIKKLDLVSQLKAQLLKSSGKP